MLERARLLMAGVAAAALGLGLVWFAASARGAEAPAPVAVVERLHSTLLEVMREADTLGFDGRRERLAPVIDEVFDLPYVARLVLGREWRGLPEADRDRFVDVFRRLTVATYAGRFDGYSGERFVTLETRESKRGRRLVRAAIEKADGERVRLDYLLHERGGGWRIINVVADGVSDLSLKRAEYAAIIKAEGFAALLAKLEERIEEQRS